MSVIAYADVSVCVYVRVSVSVDVRACVLEAFRPASTKKSPTIFPDVCLLVRVCVRARMPMSVFARVRACVCPNTCLCVRVRARVLNH